MRRSTWSSGWTAFLREERGSYSAWNLCFLALIAMLGGFAVDVSNAYRHRAMLQATLDTAASAAVIDLPDVDAAIASGLAIARENLDPAIFGEGAITAGDIEFGFWDPDTGSPASAFTPTVENANAVRMRMATEQARGNAVSTLALRAFGHPNFDISVESTAVMVGGIQQCPAGFLSRGAITVKVNNSYKNTCMHGAFRQNSLGNRIVPDGFAVSMESGNTVDPSDSIVSMPDPSTQFVDGGGNVGVAAPYNEDGVTNSASAVHESVKVPLLVDQLYCTRVKERGLVQTSADTLDAVDLLAADDCNYGTPGSGLFGVLAEKVAISADLVPDWTGSNFELEPITTWDPTSYRLGRRYVIDGDVVISKDVVGGPKGWLENVMILTTGTITIEGNLNLRNVVLFSRYGNIEVSSNVGIGDDFCASGGGEVYLLANQVDFSSNSPMDGVIVAALDQINIASNATSKKKPSRGVSMEAGAQIDLSSNNSWQSCGAQLPALYAPLAADLLAVHDAALTMLVE
ncbi:MAG: pilus assembly protein TadG-related protein [Pseudomonadota bacterium]